MLRVRVDANVMPLAAAAARHIRCCACARPALPLEELPAGSRAQAVEISGELVISDACWIWVSSRVQRSM